MAVSKSFEYINSNGVKTTVELGAKAQNVDVDGKPLMDVLDNKLERIVLDKGALGKWTCDFSGSDKLSAGSLSYDNDASIIDKGHCACSQSGGFATVTSDNEAVGGGRAYFIFPKFARSQTARKANLKIEFDIRIPVNSRWVVGLVDADRRGDYAGGSYQDSYSLNGVAACCGVDNETGLMKLNKYRLDQINSGIAEDKKNWSDKWIHFEAEVLNGNKWATCYLKDPDTGEELAKTNMAFLDNNATVNDVSVTGIEFYTWWENHIDIDNISVEIISNWDNALYMYPDGKGEYRYFVTPTGASLYEIGSLPADATATASGLMSASDKKKLDNIESGANKTTVDKSLSPTSANPVQNKAIHTALAGKADTLHTHTKADITGFDPILFGECTSSNTATAKTVNIPGFELKDRAMVVVRFTNGHKAGTNFTLNIREPLKIDSQS